MKNFFASCPRGLEETLNQEATRFNFNHVEITRGGLNFKTTPLNAINFLLETRVASRVYKEIGSFDFRNEKDLAKNAMQIPWTKILNPDDTIKITSLFSREVMGKFKNSHYLSLLLKDAIVDTFVEKAGKRPSIDLDHPNFPLLLRIEPSPKKGELRGIVSVDLAGHSLHLRGYRASGHEAPIKENLAAALLMNTSWNKEVPLYDPFCGSGTFLLEGAMMRYQIAPTYIKLINRKEGHYSFAFERQKWFQKDQAIKQPFENLCEELIARAKNGISNAGVGEFHGSDIVADPIGMLMEAWQTIGLPRKSLRINVINALDVQPDDNFSNGVLITNPPYGVRLEEKDEKLEKLYYDIGESLKNNWKGFNAYIISQEAIYRKKISLRTSMRMSFYNGSLECRLLGYELY